MKHKTLVIYNFSFGNPDDVDIFNNQAHRLSIQGYKPLFQPSLFNDTVIQQWYKEDDETKVNANSFRLFIQHILIFKEKWDQIRWINEWDKFDNWIKYVNSTWSSSKSASALYRSFAYEHYENAHLIEDGYCLKNSFK